MFIFQAHLSKLPGNKKLNFFGGTILCIAQKLKRLGFG